MDLTNIVNGIQARAAAEITAQDGDYIVDGLLYCGKCKTKKQCVISPFGEPRIVFCLCKCEVEKREAEEAERRRQEKLWNIQKLRHAGFPDEDMRNRTFEADDGSNKKLTEIAKKYVSNFGEMKKRGKGLLLFGSTGTGKTFMAACIANALIDEGRACLVTNFARLTNTLAGMFEGKQDYIDSLNRFELIVIDDLASERDTEYMGEIVQNIIDSRYRAGLPLIVTTNLTSEELKKPAEIRKQRIYSRLFEMCIPIAVEGKDRRKQKLIHEYSEYSEMLGLDTAEK